MVLWFSWRLFSHCFKKCFSFRVKRVSVIVHIFRYSLGKTNRAIPGKPLLRWASSKRSRTSSYGCDCAGHIKLQALQVVQYDSDSDSLIEPSRAMILSLRAAPAGSETTGQKERHWPHTRQRSARNQRYCFMFKNPAFLHQLCDGLMRTAVVPDFLKRL